MAVALIALLLVNALVVDGKTESAEVTVPGGRILTSLTVKCRWSKAVPATATRSS